MRTRPTVLLLGIGALVLSACSTTALSSSPTDPPDEPVVSSTAAPTPGPDDVPARPGVADDDEAGDDTAADDVDDAAADADADDTATDDTATDDTDAEPEADSGTVASDSTGLEESDGADAADESDADARDPGDAEPADDAASESRDAGESAAGESAADDAETAEPVALAVPSNVVPVAPLDPPLQAVGTGSGAETTRLQERLLELGFWLQSPDGQYGLTTRQAVMAFQKYHGLSADGVAGEETVGHMSGMTERARGRAEAGTMVEVDKSRQLLFFVVDGTTEWVLNTSTGTEVPYERPNSNDPEIIERGSSVTPVGVYRVDRERPEGWWEGDLGEIYRPKYFIGGVAVHGSNSIPNYPASHGCVRVSVPAMDWIWDQELMPMNSPVWVHGAIPS